MWYVATENRGLLPCGNSAAYNGKEPVVNNSITYVAMDTHKKEPRVEGVKRPEPVVTVFRKRTTPEGLNKVARAWRLWREPFRFRQDA